MFPTKERMPYLCFFETISIEESNSKTPNNENDLDYLRLQYDLYSHDKLPERISEDYSKAKEQENKNFKNLKEYLKHEKILIKNFKYSRIEYNTRNKGKSKSADFCKFKTSKPKKKKVKQFQYMNEQELKDIIDFSLKILQKCKNRKIQIINIQILEELYETLREMRFKINVCPTSDNNELLKNIFESSKISSPYIEFDSYKLRRYIVKAGDEMKQEKIII